MNESAIIQSHLKDLAERAYNRNYHTFSDFLNMDEISTLKSTRLLSAYTLFGGYCNAERCVAGFGEEITEAEFPIVCIKIEPLQQKFADQLTHRDFLGSLMNLGINRSTLGDIAVKDNTGYLFCLESISEYILMNLTRVKHTSVNCTVAESLPEFISELPDEEELIVSSLRADAVISAVFKLSRNAASQLFSADKVYINSRLTPKEGTPLKNGDIVSARGYGKFIFEAPLGETKKKRLIVSVRVYR